MDPLLVRGPSRPECNLLLLVEVSGSVGARVNGTHSLVMAVNLIRYNTASKFESSQSNLCIAA